MRSLPFPRRLQLVKLLRAHGLRDVERLREDELKDALAKLSLLMPELAAEAPFVSSAPSSQLGGAAGEAPGLDDDEDRYVLARFREPRAFLPQGERTFVRAIAVKPRRLFVTWDTRWDLPDGGARLEVVLMDTLGDAPSHAEVARLPAAFSVHVERTAPGWYVDIPGERLAIVVRLVIDAHDGAVVVATSNLALAPPARPAPPGPLWLATLMPDVDRRTLRGAGLVKGPLPAGATLETRGDALPESVLSPQTAVADPPSSSFRFLGHSVDDAPSSQSMPARAPSSSSLAASRSVLA